MTWPNHFERHETRRKIMILLVHHNAQIIADGVTGIYYHPGFA
jgi:hypothetical protein